MHNNSARPASPSPDHDHVGLPGARGFKKADRRRGVALKKLRPGGDVGRQRVAGVGEDGRRGTPWQRLAQHPSGLLGRARRLQHPRQVEFMDVLPLAGPNKIDRKLLKARARELWRDPEKAGA